MKRVVVDLHSQIGKPVIIRRFEYHVNWEEDDYHEVLSIIQAEHGPTMPIAGHLGMLVVTQFIPSDLAGARPAPKPISRQIIDDYHREEDFLESDVSPSKGKKRSRR